MDTWEQQTPDCRAASLDPSNRPGAKGRVGLDPESKGATCRLAGGESCDEPLRPRPEANDPGQPRALRQ